MKNKILALILLLPLMAYLIIFSVSMAVGVNIEIHACAIEITTPTENGILYVNYANSDDIFIHAEVLPTTAKNRDYYFKVEEIEDEDYCEASVDTQGRLSLGSLGSAKITVISNDGGFTDSILLIATSSKAVEVTPMLRNILGEVSLLKEVEGADYDYEMTLSSALKSSLLTANIYPATVSETDIHWTSEDPTICDVNEITGHLTPMTGGETYIQMRVPDAAHGEIEKRIKVTVDRIDFIDGIIVNGVHEDIYISKGDYSTSLYIETQDLSDINLLQNNFIAEYEFTEIATGKYKLDIVFEANVGDNVDIQLKLGNHGVFTQTIIFTDYLFSLYTAYHLSENNEIYQKLNTNVNYSVVAQVSSKGVEYSYELEDNGILTLQENNGYYTISTIGTGIANLTVIAYRNNEEISRIEKTIEVVEYVSSLAFEENAKSFGIGNVLAVGSQEIQNNEYVSSNTNLSLKVNKSRTTNSQESVILSSNNDECVGYNFVDGNASVYAKKDGNVIVYARWKYADYFNETIYTSIKLKTIQAGVKVDNYQELVKASKDGKKIVLTSSIMLGKKNATYQELVSMTSELPTDSDWQFYKNKGLQRPTVRYIVEFKNSVYGNGYEINADYITQAKDSTGMPLLFKGPLDFVSIANASVKAQDNIVFLIRTANIAIDNVVLKGCSDESLYENNTLNLAKLNYVGTTLEVSANARITNSRISNGRTAVRVYGGKARDNGSPIINDISEINVKEERVTVRIESSIITNAREFLVKLGSNTAIAAVGNTQSTFKVATLNKKDGTPYNMFANNLQDDYFVDNYLIADLTLKNCVLTGSGLFAIGIDTHFSGEMLNSAIDGLTMDYWTNCAATSLATALHFEGDVKIAEWKNIKNMDSSTLIETTGDVNPFLKLDISAMLKAVSAKNELYKNVITSIDGETYVHGGIACYGGGYNYANLDFSKYEGEAFKDYKINLTILADDSLDITDPINMQGKMLPLAAGYQDFRFMIYDNSANFNYAGQQKLMNEGNLFNWIKSAD